MSDILLFLPELFKIALALCMVWVMISDASHYIISNRLNAVVLALYVAAVFLLVLDPLPALGAAGIMLLVGLGLFSLGLMGGGDIKLLVVLTLWTGWDLATPQFLFLTAILGGALVLIVLPARAILPPIWLKLRPGKPLPRLLTRKQPVPYGIAIAAAFLWLMAIDGVPTLG